jgi:hypothetical protein
MVKRLGLQEQHTSVSARPAIKEATLSQRSAISRSAVIRIAAVALIIGSVALLAYLYPRRSADGAIAAPEPSSGTAGPSGGTYQPSGPLTMPAGSKAAPAAPQAPSSDGSLAASAIEFNWPGGDCWDIFRGDQLVTHQCGSNKQALGAGTYTIKAKYAPVFTPFQVNIKNGAATRIEKGGKIVFNWPGGDCWDIFREADLVTHQCGSNQQALEAGVYTIKGKYAPVFIPFQVNIKTGAETRVEKGGVFFFNWPGADCWDILRGADLVTHQCGSNKQALGAGTYTIKGKYAAVFEPFQIKVVDGAQVKAP